MLCPICNKNEVDTVHGFCYRCLEFHSFIMRDGVSIRSLGLSGEVFERFAKLVESDPYRFQLPLDAERERQAFVRLQEGKE